MESTDGRQDPRAEEDLTSDTPAAIPAVPAGSSAAAGRRQRLAVLVGFNGLAQIAPMLATLAITPLLLARLGLDRFGIWALALVILSTLTALDGGVSASLARFFALYAARGDRAEMARLLLGGLLVFVALGLLLAAIAFPLGPWLVGLVDMPADLRQEAVVLLRWLPLLAMIALMSDATAALLQGTGRFRALAAAMSASAATYVLAVVILVQPGAHLETLVAASGLRYGVLLLTGLLAGASALSFRRPLLPTRGTRREIGRYASRMQVSAVTGFVNGELDALVVAAVLPVRYVGLYGIALQAAAAARSLPLYAFAPLLTRLTMTFREQGRDAAAAEFDRLESRWLPAVLGYAVVAVSAVGFSVPIWLGDRYAVSGAAATILLAGFMVHVTLTGMRTCYVRAVGRPGLETRYSLVWTAGNALLTVPLALLAGLLGVVTATATAGIVASTYFVVLCRRRERLPFVLPPLRWWGLAALASGITVAGELALLQTGLHGFLGLALAGVPALVGLSVLGKDLRRARG